MKTRPAATAATITTAATLRGVRYRSRKFAAGDSMVPTTKAITTGRKNAFAAIQHRNHADDEQRNQREGHHVRAADYRRRLVCAVGDWRAVARVCKWTLTGKHAHVKSPRARSRGSSDQLLKSTTIGAVRKFHRGDVKIITLDSFVFIAACAGTVTAPLALAGQKYPRDAHPRGQHMTQIFAPTRRPSSRAANALVLVSALAGALLLAPIALVSAASAQTLGYAPTESGVVAPDDTGTAPARRRRRWCAAGAAPPHHRQSRYPRDARHCHHRYPQYRALLCAGRRPRHPLRRWRRPPGLYLVRRRDHQPQGGVAGLVSAVRDDRAPALSAAIHGRRSRQSARRARDVSRLQRVPHPRHQRSHHHRQVRLLGLYPPDQ